MLAKIFATILLFILGFIEKVGYLGVFFLMALESVNIPIPSEMIMPFSGFLVSQGHFNLLILVIVGALGNLFGSLISYAIALAIGKPLIGYLKRIPFFADDYEKAERFFSRYGSASVFWGRMLPVIRTFISFPAGLFRMPIGKFSVLTFSGSFLWSGFMALVGFYLGENWAILEGYFRKFDYLIAIIIVAVLGYYIYNKIKSRK